MQSQTALFLNDASPTLRRAEVPQEIRPAPSADEGIYPKLKRVVDVVFASTLSIVAIPVAAVVALLIKLDSPGPVLYRQVRIGVNRRRLDRRRFGRRARASNTGRRSTRRRTTPLPGMKFEIVKFRTMRTDAERNGPQWSVDGDPRITRFGQILRQSHLDEIPQLVNVLKGEMSVVGPRPERPELIKKLSPQVPQYSSRLDIKPGVTGLAQIRHRSDRTIHDVKKKVRYDLLYKRSAGLATDLKIMAGTVPMALGWRADEWVETLRKKRFGTKSATDGESRE